MRTLWQDLRYACRMLVKSPGFTAVGALTLALGIGANTAIFSVLDAVLLKSLPYHDPDRLVMVWGDERSVGNHRSQVSATDVADWRAQSHVFEDLATVHDWTPVLTGNGEPERIPGALVGDGFFQVMNGKPLLGRVFLPEEQIDGKDQEVILSYGLWLRRFGGDPNIISKTILLNSRLHTVVGVMPAGFQSLPYRILDGPPAQFYRPVGENYDEVQRASRHLRAIARLKPNVSVAQAQSEMNLIAARLEQEHPKYNFEYGARLVSLKEDLVGSLRPTLLLLFGAVGLVLLIASANVANLLLARAAARQREMAIRAALGAGRARLARQLLTESALLSVLGGALGLLLAVWGISLIESVGAEVIRSLNEVHVSLPVLGFTAAISLLTGMLFGLAPALHVSRTDVNEALKEGGRASSTGLARSRLRSALVVSEVALALILLVSAGLLIRSLVRLRSVNPGFNPSNLLTMNIYLPSAKYAKGPQQVSFYNQLIARIEGLPGVKSAGVVQLLPLGTNFDFRELQVEGQPKPPGQDLSVSTYIASPGYLRALQIPLLKGRLFTEHDTADASPVALASETMARNLWPGENPIGKQVRVSGPTPIEQQPWHSVIGVVSDVKQSALDAPPEMQLYMPEAQLPVSWMTLVVRTETNPAAMTGPVREQIRALDKDQAVFSIATMDELLANSVALRRFSMLLLGLFAAVAVILAAVGIFGVMAYVVSQRTHEIGVRMALGARPRDVLRLVLGQGLALVLGGIAVGVVAAMMLTRLLASLLFDVRPTDPTTFGAVSCLLALVAMLACYIPARRAMRVDPMVALRYE